MESGRVKNWVLGTSQNITFQLFPVVNNKTGSGMGIYQVQYSYTYICIQVLLHLCYFSFYFSRLVNPIYLSSRLPIPSCICWTLLLNSYSEFIISVIVLYNSRLFIYNFSLSIDTLFGNTLCSYILLVQIVFPLVLWIYFKKLI